MTVGEGGIQISHNAEDVGSTNVIVEKDSSVKGMKLDKELEQEKYISEAMKKTGGNKFSDNAKEAESKQPVTEEKDVLVHETEIPIAVIYL